MLSLPWKALAGIKGESPICEGFAVLDTHTSSESYVPETILKFISQSYRMHRISGWNSTRQQAIILLSWRQSVRQVVQERPVVAVRASGGNALLHHGRGATLSVRCVYHLVCVQFSSFQSVARSIWLWRLSQGHLSVLSDGRLTRINWLRFEAAPHLHQQASLVGFTCYASKTGLLVKETRILRPR